MKTLLALVLSACVASACDAPAARFAVVRSYAISPVAAVNTVTAVRTVRTPVRNATVAFYRGLRFPLPMPGRAIVRPAVRASVNVLTPNFVIRRLP